MKALLDFNEAKLPLDPVRSVSITSIAPNKALWRWPQLVFILSKWQLQCRAHRWPPNVIPKRYCHGTQDYSRSPRRHNWHGSCGAGVRSDMHISGSENVVENALLCHSTVSLIGLPFGS
jgi:hypothetical protein